MAAAVTAAEEGFMQLHGPGTDLSRRARHEPAPDEQIWQPGAVAPAEQACPWLLAGENTPNS